jgi:hypothetical protein
MSFHPACTIQRRRRRSYGVRGPFARAPSVPKQFVFRSMWCRCARAAIEIDVKCRTRNSKHSLHSFGGLGAALLLRYGHQKKLNSPTVRRRQFLLGCSVPTIDAHRPEVHERVNTILGTQELT